MIHKHITHSHTRAHRRLSPYIQKSDSQRESIGSLWVSSQQTINALAKKKRRRRSPHAFNCSRQGGIHGSLLAFGLAMRTNQMASIFILFFSLWFGHGYKLKSSLISTKTHTLDSAIVVQIKELASSNLKILWFGHHGTSQGAYLHILCS
jgi:hypothetical protein